MLSNIGDALALQGGRIDFITECGKGSMGVGDLVHIDGCQTVFVFKHRVVLPNCHYYRERGGGASNMFI